MIVSSTNHNIAFGDSYIHKVAPGIKLLLLFVLSIVLFAIPSFPLIGGTFILVVALFFWANIGVKTIIQQLRPILWLMLALFVFQLFTTPWQQAVLVTSRLIVLFMFASLVTLTTPVSKMMETLEKFFRFFKPLGINPAKISLVLSLTMRFMPVFSQTVEDVRAAQKARGLERHILALIIPVLIRILKVHQDVADAIEARGLSFNDHNDKK